MVVLILPSLVMDSDFDDFSDNNILNSISVFVLAALDGTGKDYLGNNIENHKGNAANGEYKATLTFHYVD